VHDEISPNTHEGLLDLWREVWIGGSKIRCHINFVLRCRHRILILECGRAFACEGFCKPVAGADKGGFYIDIIGALLLTRSKLGFIESSRAHVT